MNWKKGWIIVAALGFLTAGWTATGYGFPEAAFIGRPAKNFTLKDLQSKNVSLSDFRGKVVLLNFFSTWCPPCRTEIPDLVNISKKTGRKDFVVLGISLDTDDVPMVVKQYVREMNIPYSVLIGKPGVVEDYQVFGIPTTFLITKDGKINKRFEGLVPQKQFEKALNKLLGEKS